MVFVMVDDSQKACVSKLSYVTNTNADMMAGAAREQPYAARVPPLTDGFVSLLENKNLIIPIHWLRQISTQ